MISGACRRGILPCASRQAVRSRNQLAKPFWLAWKRRPSRRREKRPIKTNKNQYPPNKTNRDTGRLRSRSAASNTDAEMFATMENLALTIANATKVSGLGRSTLYEAIGAGKLEARKAGNRTLIL